ncbi:hypothetical protein M3Y97_01068500 [Aphelenchoides bicaudatus]|nr:hypothetical protein M3Y97_01068500 [Aphelenchoides bicaudatus]
MTKIRLHYFDARGRAEGIGNSCITRKSHMKKSQLERTSGWKRKRVNYKYGQVPALEVDGQMLYQSNAIIRYLARKHGMEGKDAWETAKLDEINELLNEFHEAITEYIYVSLGFMPGDKDKLRQEKFIPAWQKYGPHFEQALKEAGSGYYTQSPGSERMATMEPDLVKDFPLFVEHGKRINALPELQEYIKTRPKA